MSSNIELGKLAGNGVSADAQPDGGFIFLAMGEFEGGLDQN